MTAGVMNAAAATAVTPKAPTTPSSQVLALIGERESAESQGDDEQRRVGAQPEHVGHRREGLRRQRRDGEG